jgi:2-methylcitrate dehydratase PrpD
MSTSLSERLVEVALEAGSGPQNPAIRGAAARTLFDFFACVIAGNAEVAPTWPIDPAGRLAVSAHLVDQDDLHYSSLTHPGGVIWSSVTATALERESSLCDTFTAAAFGYELVVRLSEAFGAEHRRRWHATTTAGTVGAAGAAALLFGGDRAAINDAVGQAISVAGGSVQALFERSGTRFLHRAHAAASGVACARGACSGLHASRFGLEYERGAFAAQAPAPRETELLGSRAVCAIDETGFRLYPATGFAHGAIDAALQLGPLDPETIDRIEVAVSPHVALELASNRSPGNDEEAWWSIEHAVVLALAVGNADALSAGRVRDEGLRALCRRVELIADGGGWSAAVKVVLKDGQIKEASVEAPRGHPDRPASNSDLRDKWRRLCGRDGSPFLERLLEADGDTSFSGVLMHELDAHGGFGWLTSQTRKPALQKGDRA